MGLLGGWAKLKRRIAATLSEQIANQIFPRLAAQIEDQMRGPIATLIENRIRARLAAIEDKIDRLETFSHGARATYVGNNRVLTKIVLDGNQIAFFVEADDRLLSPWFIATGTYETQLTDYFLRELRPHSHCIDVGANFGYFTCLMARFCSKGRVIGIEPDEHVFEIARDNVLINGFEHFASVIQAAAGNTSADITLHRRSTRSANTGIARPSHDLLHARGEQPSQAFVAKSLRIDDLLPQMSNRVDFMKIDVEGAEPLVLEGANLTIATNPDLTIVMEWSPGQIQQAGLDVPAFAAALGAAGLSCYDIAPSGLVPLPFDNLLNIPYRTGIVLKRVR